jgi:hypothetical protein
MYADMLSQLAVISDNISQCVGTFTACFQNSIEELIEAQPGNHDMYRALLSQMMHNLFGDPLFVPDNAQGS